MFQEPVFVVIKQNMIFFISVDSPLKSNVEIKKYSFIVNE